MHHSADICFPSKFDTAVISLLFECFQNRLLSISLETVPEAHEKLLMLFRACALVHPYSVYTPMADYKLLVYALMEQPGSSSYLQGVIFFVALYATSFTQHCDSRGSVLTPIGTVLYYTFHLGSPTGVK